MKDVNVCCVTFNRYDLLKRLFDSIDSSTVKPAGIYVIDRGHDSNQVMQAAGKHLFAHIVLDGQSLPAAWNWFMRNVPEERVIASDDIEFYPNTLETFLNTPGDFVGIEDGKSSHFACFMPRNSLIRKIGYFDETISPDYMYFEDSDYGYRMKLAGIPLTGNPNMYHGLMKSWEKKTPEQQAEHHPKFIQAEQNYIRKWGGKPFEETYTVPYNGAM